MARKRRRKNPYRFKSITSRNPGLVVTKVAGGMAKRTKITRAF